MGCIQIVPDDELGGRGAKLESQDGDRVPSSTKAGVGAFGYILLVTFFGSSGHTFRKVYSLARTSERAARLTFYGEGNERCLPHEDLCLHYATGMYDYEYWSEPSRWRPISPAPWNPVFWIYHRQYKCFDLN
jgi:hypothetical protein